MERRATALRADQPVRGTSAVRQRVLRFPGNSRWTPFFGFGFGWAAAELHYYLQFIRKSEAEYLQIEFDPDWPDVAKRAAAGTASILDTRASENVFGYQLLVGVDYELSQSLSVGALLRWARFDDIGHEAVYDVLRDHAGVLADGVTPFNNELTFSGRRVSGVDR